MTLLNQLSAMSRKRTKVYSSATTNFTGSKRECKREREKERERMKYFPVPFLYIFPSFPSKPSPPPEALTRPP